MTTAEFAALDSGDVVLLRTSYWRVTDTDYSLWGEPFVWAEAWDEKRKAWGIDPHPLYLTRHADHMTRIDDPERLGL